jgi:hypothetical protein
MTTMKITHYGDVKHYNIGNAHEFKTGGDTLRFLKWNPGVSYSATDAAGAYRFVNVVDVGTDRHFIASFHPDGTGLFKASSTWSIITDVQSGEVLQVRHSPPKWFSRDQQYFLDNPEFQSKLAEAGQFISKHADIVARDPEIKQARTAAEMVMGRPSTTDRFIEAGPELQASLPRALAASRQR